MLFTTQTLGDLLMQIKSSHKAFYKLSHYSGKFECYERYHHPFLEKIKKYQEALAEGASPSLCAKYAGISRATYYRYRLILKNLLLGIIPPSKQPPITRKPSWGQKEINLVLSLRKEHPSYGKEKITLILKRDHLFPFSESTVGRILSALKKKGKITKSPSALRPKPKRKFNHHAKPWEFKKYELMELGERVQIDHMTVRKNGTLFKHFQSWDRSSKYVCAEVYSNANASSAKRFLQKLLQETPFPIRSLQVDGGSEFRADFEQACADLKIPLFVLPPAKPQYNGGVERANRTFREEFYDRADLLEDTIQGMRTQLQKALFTYNHFRPHKNLNGITPMEYLQNNIKRDSISSQII
jgi:hypothetical protein